MMKMPEFTRKCVAINFTTVCEEEAEGWRKASRLRHQRVVLVPSCTIEFINVKTLDSMLDFLKFQFTSIYFRGIHFSRDYLESRARWLECRSRNEKIFISFLGSSLGVESSRVSSRAEHDEGRRDWKTSFSSLLVQLRHEQARRNGKSFVWALMNAKILHNSFPFLSSPPPTPPCFREVSVSQTKLKELNGWLWLSAVSNQWRRRECAIQFARRRVPRATVVDSPLQAWWIILHLSTLLQHSIEQRTFSLRQLHAQHNLPSYPPRRDLRLYWYSINSLLKALWFIEELHSTWAERETFILELNV